MTPNQIQSEFEELDQYDYINDEYLDLVRKRYEPLIGRLLISFSALEHCLNYEIAERISERAHNEGYVIIEKLTMMNKIELYNKLFLGLLNSTRMGERLKEKLKIIKAELIEINTFRNIVVHANWTTLTEEKLVRTKIVVDNDDGFVKFKKIQVTPKLIYSKCKRIEKLINKIEFFTESAFDTLNS